VRTHGGSRLLLAAGSLLVLCGAAPAAVLDDAVTLNVSHHLNPNGAVVLVFEGTVGSRNGGEVVEVIGRNCGAPSFGLVAAARTRSGGTWGVVYPNQRRPWRYPPVQSGSTYRARWEGQLSAPRTYRVEAPVTVSPVPGRLARRVHVSPPPPGTVGMRGKPVLLQRLRGRDWVTIGRKALVHKPSYEHGALNHEAVFAVEYGWTLRFVLPAKSAAPCYRETVTEPFRVWWR
jgi:hypothetical protein